MDCTIVKDKILDYIDGILNEEDKSLVKDHLESCAECNGEYQETKMTIDYIESNNKKIDLSREVYLKLYKAKSKYRRKITRTGFVAVTLLLILMITSYATDIFDFMKLWKRVSDPIISSWEELLDNGVGDKLDISVVDKDIKITAEGVIADDLNTVIFIRIEDLKGNNKFTPNRGTKENPESLIIGGDVVNSFKEISENFDFPPMVDYSSLYTEEENSIIVKIITEVLTSDKGNVDISIDSLTSVFNESKESILTINGNWSLTIPATKIKSKTKELNQVVEFGGNELLIENITIAPTGTNIKYRLKRYNEKEKYFIDNIDLSIEYNDNKYKHSPFNSSFSDLDNDAYIIRNKIFNSLYLKDPESIELIIESYDYTIKDRKYYKIDINNLPQTIKYNRDKLIIQEIIYNEDNTEVIIIEDKSKNRKYNYSILDIKAKDNSSARCYTTLLDFERRNEKGKILKDGEVDQYTHYVYKKQKLVLENNLRWIEITGQKPKTYELIPEGLFIEGQEYTEYPNKKITIKLK